MLSNAVCVDEGESDGAQEESAASPPAGQISRRSHCGPIAGYLVTANSVHVCSPCTVW